MDDIILHKVRIDSGVTVPGEKPLHIAIEVHAPATMPGLPILLVCLPGGAMNRRYFDLQAEREDGSPDDSYSFAAQMTHRGFLCALVDHAGVGESDQPADGYALTPEVVALANSNAIGRLLDELRGGTLDRRFPAMPQLLSVLVGHSMGAMFTVLQQATTCRHAAIATLGFCTRGLPDFLTPEARELAADTAAVRGQLVRLARAAFVEPYPTVKRSPASSSMFAGSNAEPRGTAALKAATDHMLPVPAFMSMLPGNVAPEAARIDVPVFIGVGERDMVGAPHDIPASFPSSRDVTLRVLPETGHSHFLFPSRHALFDRLANWARAVLPGR